MPSEQRQALRREEDRAATPTPVRSGGAPREVCQGLGACETNTVQGLAGGEACERGQNQ